MKRIRKPRPRPTFRATPIYVPLDGPRPNASQIVAAQHRAQPGRPTHDTEPIAPMKKALPRQWLPLAAAGVLLVLAMVALATYGVPERPTALRITAQPSAAPTSVPAAPTPAPTAVQTILAYAAPDGAVLGPVEIDRMMTPKAHAGPTWIQADVEGSGLVWVRASDVPDLAIVGPDLSPVVAAVPPAQSGQGLTLYQPPVQPQIEQAPFIVSTEVPTMAVPPTDVPIVEITPRLLDDTPLPASEFGGPGSSSGGSW